MSREDRIIQIASTFALIAADVFLLIYMQLTPYKIDFISLGPYAFPRGILVIILLLSVYHLIKEIVQLRNLGRNAGVAAVQEPDKDPEEQAPKKEWLVPLPAIVCMASLVVYYAAWHVIGFSLSTIIYLTAISKFLHREEKIWKCLAVAVVATIVIDALFVFGFGINLPDAPLDYLRYEL